MENEIIINMPLFLTLAKSQKGKRYHLNLNNYRNWHYQVSNNLKVMYSHIASKKLLGLKFERIELVFTLYPKDARARDRANVLCIHEKFFCDSMVTSGCLADDNDKYITASHYFTGSIDKINPRVEIKIKAIDNES